jgi:FixJ family two-component response regulator
VDDDDRVRGATASVLRSMGYATRSFVSGAQLLAGDLDGIGCILSDYQMPEMSGLDLLAALKTRAPALPVIIMTGYASDGVAEQALRLGAVGFLEKPFDETVLDDLVTRALG